MNRLTLCLMIWSRRQFRRLQALTYSPFILLLLLGIYIIRAASAAKDEFLYHVRASGFVEWVVIVAKVALTGEKVKRIRRTHKAP